MMHKAVFCIAAGLLAGCVSFDGRELVPGRSTAAEVEAVMGAAADRQSRPNGETALYFSRLPAGRAMFVVTLGPDGVMRSIEQRLDRRHFARIAAGRSTKQDVREILGPPGNSGRFERQAREWWEYKFRALGEMRVFWVQFSNDGVVREVMDMADPEEIKPAIPSHSHH